MIYYNPKSTRVNPFQQVYDSPDVRQIPNPIPHFPAFVDIEPTNLCNLNCRMCPRSPVQRKQGFMDINLFKKVVRECKKVHCPVRLIGWGEPFLHPQIQKLIKYVKQSSPQLLHITTNGLAFKKYDMECMLGYDVDSIIFSFQGVNEFGYNFMRNTHQFNKLVSTINDFLTLRGSSEKPFVQITTTTTNESAKQINEFLGYWISKVDAISVGKTNFDILPKYIPQNELLKPRKPLKHVPCTEVYHQIQVDWDGKVSPCCGDFDNYLTIGDVNNEKIRKIWNKSEKLQYIREQLKTNGNEAFTLCQRCFPSYKDID
jgi:radical SAM protein with 4Fe4S-binding SPASM domain